MLFTAEKAATQCGFLISVPRSINTLSIDGFLTLCQKVQHYAFLTRTFACNAIANQNSYFSFSLTYLER